MNIHPIVLLVAFKTWYLHITISWCSDGAHPIHQITDCFSDQQDIQNGSSVLQIEAYLHGACTISLWYLWFDQWHTVVKYECCVCWLLSTSVMLCRSGDEFGNVRLEVGQRMVLCYIKRGVKLLFAQQHFFLNYAHCIASNCYTDLCVCIVFPFFLEIP